MSPSSDNCTTTKQISKSARVGFESEIIISRLFFLPARMKSCSTGSQLFNNKPRVMTGNLIQH